MMLVSHQITLGESDRVVDFEFEADYTPGTRPHFSPTFGNWLPGDPAEVDIFNVRACSIDGIDPADLGDGWQEFADSIIEAWIDRQGRHQCEAAAFEAATP